MRSHPSSARLAAVLLPALLFGCGGGGGATGPAPESPIGPPGTDAPNPSDPEEPEGGTGTSPGMPSRDPAGSLPLGIRFEDTTDAAGIADTGISFGASVGDVDGDGWPDVFTSGHYTDHAKLWRNRGDGTFEAVPLDQFDPVPTADLHAANLIDLDEDGRDEIVLLTGACFGECTQPNRCYVHDHGTGQFVDEAEQLGLSASLMRARTPVAFDYGADGRIDLFYTALLRSDGQSPPTLFEQLARGVFAANPVVDLTSQSKFATLGDLDGDGTLDIFFDTFDNTAWSFAGGAAVDITATIGLPHTPRLTDALIVDLDGDGENEIYCARRDTRSQFHRSGANHVEAMLVHRDTPQGLRIRPSPQVSSLRVRFPPNRLPDGHVFAGASGFQPSNNSFLLSPGLAFGTPPVPTVFPSLTIGWDPATGDWTLTLYDDGYEELMLLLETGEPIATIDPIGFDPAVPALSDVVLARRDGAYVDVAASMGLDLPLESRSVVAADFDNDMDLDLYVVTGTGTENPENVLLENLGDGTFRAIDPGPAQGSKLGIGDAVVTLDYDRDGRVDLFVASGADDQLQFVGESGAFADDGPVELFRNVTTNRNRWLALDLVGTTSHRSAIGARVEVTAGGVTQVREVNGGAHRFSQNHRTVHFGLGKNQFASRIEVQWPNGEVTVLEEVAGNQQLTIEQ